VHLGYIIKVANNKRRNTELDTIQNGACTGAVLLQMSS